MAQYQITVPPANFIIQSRAHDVNSSNITISRPTRVSFTEV